MRRREGTRDRGAAKPLRPELAVRVNSEFRPPESPRSIPRNLRAKESPVKEIGPGHSERAGPSLKLCFSVISDSLGSGREREPESQAKLTYLCLVILLLPGRTLGGSKVGWVGGPEYREVGRHNYCRAGAGWIWGQVGSWRIGKLSQGFGPGPCNKWPTPIRISVGGIGIEPILFFLFIGFRERNICLLFHLFMQSMVDFFKLI